MCWAAVGQQGANRAEGGGRRAEGRGREGAAASTLSSGGQPTPARRQTGRRRAFSGSQILALKAGGGGPIASAIQFGGDLLFWSYFARVLKAFYMYYNLARAEPYPPVRMDGGEVPGKPSFRPTLKISCKV